VKILVVDDEPLARERLVRLLAELRPGALCSEAGSGAEALEMVHSRNPDLVLLDIRMPGVDGLEVAAGLDTLDHPPAVIFCTAYDEYALQALRHQAVAYLLKPVRRRDLERALDSAARVNRMQLSALERTVSAGDDRRRTRVSSHTHRGLETMAVEEIRCFLAEQKYVTALSPGGELTLTDTLRELESEFGDRFLRVHRNALVSLEHILRLERHGGEGWRVVLEGVEARPGVSRRHLAEVKRRLTGT